MTHAIPYRFGARGQAARAALKALPDVTSERVPDAVRVALQGGERADRVLAVALSRKLLRTEVAEVVQALGDPARWSMRERSCVAAMLAACGLDPQPWADTLAAFPLSTGTASASGVYAGRTPARLFPGEQPRGLEAFVDARVEMASRPGDVDAARRLRDTALALDRVDTLAELVDTGWLDETVAEHKTMEAVHALPWSTHGTSKLAFADRVDAWRPLLAEGGPLARHLAALIDLSRGHYRRAQDGLAPFMEHSAGGWLMAAAHLGGQDGANQEAALRHVADRRSWEFILKHATAASSVRAAEVLDHASRVSIPGPRDPARRTFVLVLARSVEVGRPTAEDRDTLERVLAQVPAWRELLPPADAAWQRAARALSEPGATPPDVATALHDLFVVETRAAWFVAVADRLADGPRHRWLVDSYGSPSALGVQVHALVCHAIAAVPLARLTASQRSALQGIDVLGALRAARGIAFNQPALFEGGPS